MHELNFDRLVLKNAVLIKNWSRSIAGITLLCTEEPDEHLSLFDQVILLRKLEKYYLTNVINNHLEEVDNVWDGLVLPTNLQAFWDLYVKDVEVIMEHSIDEEDDEGIPKYPVDGLGSGLLSL
jgi:hypothetical protein